MNSRPFSRRDFLRTTAAAAGTLAFRRPARAADGAKNVSFFLVGDTHYLANKEQPERLDEVSAGLTGRLLETLNRLPGTPIPDGARAGVVAPPHGLIHVGDLIDSGDKNGAVYERMQQTEWQAWAADFGLSGSDGRLEFPAYELHGNHDAPRGKGLVLDRIIERNRQRPGVTNVAPNGLHYSWDWERVHFVSLGLIVGTERSRRLQRGFDPVGSLEFLTADLAEKVGSSGRPVVILHHVDLAHAARPCDPAAPPVETDWDACDVHAFYKVLEPYHVAAVFYGHTHARNILRWDGVSAKAAEGIPVFNVDNASHFKSDAQAFFHVEISERELLVREYATADRWETGAWTPLSWAVPLRA